MTAHEFFHVWNVKRIRPYVLGPFDYQGANRTESLWVSEGMTNTYTDFTGVRTGHLTSEEFYEDVARAIASWMGDEAQPYVVIYQMARDRDGRWQLRNLVVENVNLGQIYRSQFEAAARRYDGDLDAVIDNWDAGTLDEA